MILAVESSCDESAIALLDPKTGWHRERIYSQIDLHQVYGGVVPDLASREHLLRFAPLLEDLQREHNLAGVSKIAVTQGPGLAGCLAIGVAFAKALALAWGKPLLGVNHLRGHAFSPFFALLREGIDGFAERLRDHLPHLGLIVSGGNTILFEIDRERRITLLAETVDDAAGEALDKGAKLLGMPYPGGPLIEKRAREGAADAFSFPVGILERTDMRFSFSGLKTSLRYQLEKMDDASLERALPSLCASYQEAVVAQLARKTASALAQRPYQSLGLSGGVANNERLRRELETLGRRAGIPVLLADRAHTGDNATMIAFAAVMDEPGCAVAEADLSLPIEPGLRLV